MDLLLQILIHTPIWVWVILAFLVWRGVAAMRPGRISLQKLAIVPVLFSVWGLWSISHRYGGSGPAWAGWLVGVGVGAALGWRLLRRATLTRDAATGALWRGADYSQLPLLLVTFLIKFGFEVAFAVAPPLVSVGSVSAAYLLLSGAFTGMFIGRFAWYVVASRRSAVSGLELAG